MNVKFTDFEGPEATVTYLIDYTTPAHWDHVSALFLMHQRGRGPSPQLWKALKHPHEVLWHKRNEAVTVPVGFIHLKVIPQDLRTPEGLRKWSIDAGVINLPIDTIFSFRNTHDSISLRYFLYRSFGIFEPDIRYVLALHKTFKNKEGGEFLFGLHRNDERIHSFDCDSKQMSEWCEHGIMLVQVRPGHKCLEKTASKFAPKVVFDAESLV